MLVSHYGFPQFFYRPVLPHNLSVVTGQSFDSDLREAAMALSTKCGLMVERRKKCL